LDEDQVEYLAELYPDGVIVSEKLLFEILNWDRGEADGLFNRLYPLILKLLSPTELKEVMLLSIQNRWRLVEQIVDDVPELLGAWTNDDMKQTPQTADGRLRHSRP
jgi:hypothetical protein